MKPKFLRTVLFVFCTCVRLQLPSTGEAQDFPTIELPETVITANRVETPRENVGRSVENRSEAEFAAQQSPALSDNLQTVSGLRTAEIGGPGSPGVTPMEIRGFRSGGTQFLLNGLRYNDPSSVSGTNESFASYFLVNDLEGVEVLKGATSALYGSDGQAGAVNFLMRKPTAGNWAEFALQGGSFDTFQESVIVNAGTDQIGAIGTISRIDSGGIDANGDYENTSVSLVGYGRLSETLTVEPIVRLISARSDLDQGPTLNDAGGFVPSTDSATDHFNGRHLFLGTSFIARPEDHISSKLSLASNDARRDFYFEFGGFPYPFDYVGQSFNADWQTNYRIPQSMLEFVAGLDFEHQRAESNSPEVSDSSKQDRYGAYVLSSLHLLDDTLSINGGARMSHISAVGRTLPTLELSSTYRLPSVPLRVHSSIAQGFRAPTLYETDGLAVDYNTSQIVTVGSRNLHEEESLTFDLGVTADLDERSSLDVTFFNTRGSQSILFDFENLQHVNGGNTQTQGVEASLVVQPAPWLLIRSGLTHLSKASGLDTQRLQRRPYNTWATSAMLTYEQLSLFTEYRYRGDQNLAFFGTSEQFRESDSSVVNATLGYFVTSDAQIFVRANNIFDRDYTESGYRMPRAAVFGGIRFRLGAPLL